MSVTTQIYDKSATDMLKYSALILFIAQAVSFGLSFIDSIYIGLVGDVIHAAGLFLLGNAIYNIGMSFPIARNDADSTKRWLFIYGGSLLFYYIPIVGIVGGLVALVTGIGSFLKLNNLFKKITQSAPQQGPLDSWVFPLYALYGLIAGVVLVIVGFLTILTLGLAFGFLLILVIVVGAGGILLSLGVVYVLYQNSVKLERIRQSIDFSQLAPAIIPGVYAPIQTPQPIPIVSEVQNIKHCSNCGTKLIATDKFCLNCGASVS
ncbi:MAG: zinc ribbon domain-containing protein [Candidatus Heimdallarchaeota archaeon]|nr:zinc ribbon domain-containing protein [Candidatus Heimdallarchaeota archaeon]